MSKDTGAWWHTRGWLIQTIIWVAILDGILALFLFATPESEVAAGGLARDVEGLIVFLTMSLISLCPRPWAAQSRSATSPPRWASSF